MKSANPRNASKPVPTAAQRYATLAVRQGISLGALQSNHARDFAVVVAVAAQAFEAGRVYTEREVNERLRAFLAGAGSMLATDHVELRRWLIDVRVLARDGFGRAYTVGTPGPQFAAVAAQLADVDLAALARDARAQEAAARAERKERWQKSR